MDVSLILRIGVTELKKTMILFKNRSNEAYWAVAVCKFYSISHNSLPNQDKLSHRLLYR